MAKFDVNVTREYDDNPGNRLDNNPQFPVEIIIALCGLVLIVLFVAL